LAAGTTPVEGKLILIIQLQELKNISRHVDKNHVFGEFTTLPYPKFI
jgi:hypothetical protein